MPLSSGFASVGDGSCRSVRTVLGILGISRHGEVVPEKPLVDDARSVMTSRDFKDETRIWRLASDVDSKIQPRLTIGPKATTQVGMPIVA